MRIVQLANFHSPVSGGLRTAVEAVGRGYAAAGHIRVLVIPGAEAGRTEGPDGLVVRIRAPQVGAGYRVVAEPWRVHRLLDELRPDVVEVSDKTTMTTDKTTMTTAAGWARRHGARAVLFSHERLDAILAPRVRWAGLAENLADATDCWNRSLARRFDAVVVTSRFAEEEFVRGVRSASSCGCRSGWTWRRSSPRTRPRRRPRRTSRAWPGSCTPDGCPRRRNPS